MPASVIAYKVQLPSGGALHLQTPDEVDLWSEAQKKYMVEYVFHKHNDLIALGALLLQQIVVYRCQVGINGMEIELDAQGVPTGSYRRVEMDAQDLASFQRTLVDAQKEMSRLEKQLGIDKATRESGGQYTVENYLRTLKQAAEARGVHVTKMVLEHQKVRMEISWRLRMLFHTDPQDRAYHRITPKTVLEYIYSEYRRLEKLDQEFARDRGKLYVGAL